jgi:hypothetical protein
MTPGVVVGSGEIRAQVDARILSLVFIAFAS